MGDPEAEWAVFKALRAPYTAEVWELTLAELASCPRCAGGTYLVPFPAGGAAVPEGADPRSLPPLDAAVFLCCRPECLTIYLILFNADRQEEFDGLIPYLREAGRRALSRQAE